MGGDSAPVLRLLIAALGGDGGGVLTGWIVDAARRAGHPVQATSVPGVAQRTGSTSYYIEIGRAAGGPMAVPALMPMQGRVDIALSTELVETGRLIEAGFISPARTLLISSTARELATAEKIVPGDGRFAQERLFDAAQRMSRRAVLLDLADIARRHDTYLSAAAYGALSGSGALPWDAATGRAVLEDARSRAGFDAACAEVQALVSADPPVGTPPPPPAAPPPELAEVLALGRARLRSYQDAAYAALFDDRAARLMTAADLTDHRHLHAVTEACRRLALWMAYEDIPRVAQLKTDPARFARIRAELRLRPGQVVRLTEFLKPRGEEIADMLPPWPGKAIMARAQAGRWLPLPRRGLRLGSNTVTGFWLLRAMAVLRHIRRRSLRFAREQEAIEDWLNLLSQSFDISPEFASGLAELPRVLKGYSDTLLRGRRSYDAILEGIVRPALARGEARDHADRLRAAITAAMTDDTGAALEAVLSGENPATPPPDLRTPTHA